MIELKSEGRSELTQEEKLAIVDFFCEKGLPPDIAVTFEDVALPGDYSEVGSRSEINDFGVDLLPGLRLGIPMISANMESVTGYDMIIALEREGGLGILPQSLPVKQRLDILERVLRTECAVIDEPLVIGLDATLREAKKVMSQFDVSGLVVVDENRKVTGVLSSRDWRYQNNNDKKVAALISDRASFQPVITAPVGVSFDRAKAIIRLNRVEKLPLVDEEGRLAGLITARGLFYKTFRPRALRDDRGRFIRVGSIGIISQSHGLDQLLIEVELQLKKGISSLLIDTSRGYARDVGRTVYGIKRNFSFLPLIVGNVSTAQGAKFLIECGADCVKVGQGPGEACLTREVSGVGIPQITAIAECGVVARIHGKSVIGDGGVRSGNRLAKALIAGADAVMIGALFCGTKESPPKEEFNQDGFLVKKYEGSASFDAQSRRLLRGDLSYIREPEGFSKVVPVTGTVSDCVGRLLGGLRSAMSFFGARNIRELQKKGYFRRQSRAGYYEGVKHK